MGRANMVASRILRRSAEIIQPKRLKVLSLTMKAVNSDFIFPSTYSLYRTDNQRMCFPMIRFQSSLSSLYNPKHHLHIRAKPYDFDQSS